MKNPLKHFVLSLVALSAVRANATAVKSTYDCNAYLDFGDTYFGSEVQEVWAEVQVHHSAAPSQVIELGKAQPYSPFNSYFAKTIVKRALYRINGSPSDEWPVVRYRGVLKGGASFETVWSNIPYTDITYHNLHPNEAIPGYLRSFDYTNSTQETRAECYIIESWAS